MAANRAERARTHWADGEWDAAARAETDLFWIATKIPWAFSIGADAAVRAKRAEKIRDAPPPKYVEVFPSSPPELPMISLNPEALTEGERKDIYYRSTALAAFSFLVLYVLITQWFTAISGVGLWCALFVGSRLVDILTTTFALSRGAIETNPLSDPRSISRLICLQIPQSIAIAGIALAAMHFSENVGFAVLFVASLLGFEAGFANSLQALRKRQLRKREAVVAFWKSHLISIVSVSVGAWIAVVVLPSL